MRSHAGSVRQGTDSLNAARCPADVTAGIRRQPPSSAGMTYAQVVGENDSMCSGRVLTFKQKTFFRQCRTGQFLLRL